MTTTIKSLVNETPTRIDSRTAVAHINFGDSWRMRRFGYTDLMHNEAEGYIQFDVKLTWKLRVIVKLTADDLYAIEIGRIRRSRGDIEYVVIEQVRGIFWDDLGPIVESLIVKWSEASAKTL